MDKQARRRFSPTHHDKESTISQFQNNSQDLDSGEDHLAIAWKSAATAVAITWERLKRRHIIPLLQWALSALVGGQPAPPTDGAGAMTLRLELRRLERSLAEEKEKHENMRSRCIMLERTLNEEKEKRENMQLALVEHEKTRLRCLQVEKSLDEANEKRRQLERSLHQVEENAANTSSRCKHLQESVDILKPVIADAEKILEAAKEEDEKLLRQIEALRAQGIV